MEQESKTQPLLKKKVDNPSRNFSDNNQNNKNNTEDNQQHAVTNNTTQNENNNNHQNKDTHPKDEYTLDSG